MNKNLIKLVAALTLGAMTLGCGGSDKKTDEKTGSATSQPAKTDEMKSE